MIDIVVSKYKEDISWTSKLNNRFNIIAYNKIDNLSYPKNNNLPNIGRETYPYTYYIVNNYYNLPESVIFLHGFPLDHCGNIEEIWKDYFENQNSFDIYCNFANYCKYEQTDKQNEITDKLMIKFVNYLNSKNNFDTFQCFGNIVDTTDNYKREKELLYKRLNMSYDSNKFTIGAQFIVPSSLIKNKSLSFWKILLNLHISDTENQICCQSMPYTLERSWIDIFNHNELGIN
jgi:hypothetical protein